jgi:hypothetical protein
MTPCIAGQNMVKMKNIPGHPSKTRKWKARQNIHSKILLSIS